MDALLRPLIEALRADWRGGLVISLAIAFLFVSAEALRRLRGLETEHTRKLTHAGAGVVVLSSPWLLTSAWTVLALCVAFGGLLVAGRLTGLLGSVHDVERTTGGAYYYPVAVAGLFWLSDGDPLLFCAPIAVMAFADSGAALVGRRVGRNRYRVMDGARSIEGSLTFFALSFTLLLCSLALAGAAGWPEVLLIALATAALATATEAISVWGVDNLFIPYACFLVLERTLRLGLPDLDGWFEGMILSLAVVVASWDKGGLTEAGGLTVFLVGTLSWALGGWTWTLPLLALYGLFLAIVPESEPQTDLEHIFPTTVGSMIVLLAFGHFEDPTLFAPYLATLATGGSIAMQRLAQRRGWPQLPLALSGALAPVLPVLLVDASIPLAHIGIAGLAGLAAFALLARTRLVGRRLLASLLAGAIAWGAVA